MSGSTFRRLLLSATALALLLPGLAIAGEDAAAPADTPTDEVQVAPAATDGAQAVVIRWNPVTREMEEPTAAARAKILEELQKSLTATFGTGLDEKGGLITEKLPSGAVKARLPLSHLNASIVRVGADGELVEACVDGLAEAEKAAAAPASTDQANQQ